ncbi:MAG: 2-hydroxyacyl-CoA dehydratase family protein [Thermodesulfobacteriota bacterium]|nr:2-hydroxyacyl-CoA dehydratase family protein [Thermodesulfobacteriota bacterium]
MSAYYDGLLDLCGFEPGEIEAERPRIEKAFARLRIGPDDMETAEKTIRLNHDVTLRGVRKLLGAWLLELMDLVLAKDDGKKVFYFGYPSMIRPVTMLAASNENLYCACPETILCHALGQIFNKLTPLLEAGEQNGLPPGHSLCSLWQVKVGAMTLGMIPEPDLTMSSSFFCDMATKADDLLAVKYGSRIEYVDSVMDSEWGQYPDYLPEVLEFFGAEVDNLFLRVKETLGVELSADALEKANSIMYNHYSRLGRLAKLMQADPMPVSSVEIWLATMVAAACTGRGVPAARRAMDILIEEIQERIEAGLGVVEKGAPRVMFFIGNFSDAGIMHMVEGAGLAITTTFFTMPPPPKTDRTYNTLGEKLADVELRAGLFHSTYGMLKRTEDNLDYLNLDGIILNYLHNCRPISIFSHSFKQFIEEKTGVPTLALENDLYDTRNYSAVSLGTRVETFAQMLKARKERMVA